MGASIGMAHGMKKVLPPEDADRVVAVIGDSTFFHSGVTGLMDVVYTHGSGTVIVLDNRTTAMTGHQGHPGTGRDLRGQDTPRIDIAALAHAVGVDDVRDLPAYSLMDAARTIDSALKSGRPTVLIASAPCVLAERVEFGPAVAVDVSRCTECGACLRLGCPAIQLDEASRGRPVIDPLLCNGCTHCQQVCADCNAGIDVPYMLELVAQERYREAFDLVLRANPFPAIAGRICPHPCDHDANALGRELQNEFADRYPNLVTDFRSPEEPHRLSVRLVERFLGDWAIQHVTGSEYAPTETAGRSVGIVGSGPAGLSAAWYLRRRGFDVTLYDEHDEPGGMLRHGIPPFRLPAH
jgi:Pyruvate/2-oxoacid:ferredoxin oxidoreductase delta subunit